MNILIDSQAFDAEQFGGVSHCWTKIIEHIIANKTDDINIVLGIKGTFNVHLLYSSLGTQLNSDMNNWVQINRDYTLELLQTGDFDLFIPTFYDTYFLDKLNGTPYIFMIHDIISDVLLQYFNPAASLYDATHYPEDIHTHNRITLANNATKVIAISNNTKTDIINYYNIDENKIEVIYHGIDINQQQYINLINENYIVYIGSRLGPSCYKCFIPFVNQVSLFLKHHPDFKVICTSIPFSNFEKELFHQYGIENNFINMTLNDEGLTHLYHYAMCHVFSSEYEGFGLPLLEAASNQCISLYNKNNECLNEIANHHFLNYNGQLVTDLNDKLEYIYKMSKIEKQNVLQMQLERCKYFNWDKSAKQYIQLFHNICDNKK